jgi:hypothetical protein
MANELLAQTRRCFMSYKVLQLSPQASTRIPRISFVHQDPWNLQGSRDIGFLRSWFEDDSNFDPTVRNHTNWNAIAGLALTIAVSASFWAGIGWVIARIRG